MRKIIFALALPFLVGCAATPIAGQSYQHVVIDPAVCPKCDYDNDIYQCNNIVRNSTNYTGNALGGAAVGAATGAIFGAILGIDPGLMAGAGAAGGGIGGLGRESNTVYAAVVRCMQGRGYSVLR